MKPSRGREVVKQYAAKLNLVELGAEYIKEAEHQDGSSFWHNFGRAFEVRADFDLYAQNAKEQ
jgi:hypothetical protein